MEPRAQFSHNREELSEFLFTCLVESDNKDARRVILERLMPLMPFGYHPLVLIEKHSEPTVRHKLRQHHLNYLNEIKMRLDIRRLVRGGIEPDLEQGAFLISRLSGDPQWTPELFRHELDRMALPLQNRYIQEKEPPQQLEMFLEYVFHEKKLSGNTTNYYDPRNSYLTEVLRTRQGIPVSLGVLCVLLARRVAMPVFGINMPGHFMLLYKHEALEVFLDPFHQGQQFDREDCLLFLEKQYIPPSQEYLKPVSNLDILKRMYRNLIGYYSRCGDLQQEKILRQHFAILEENSVS